jgi:hypothetical protein
VDFKTEQVSSKMKAEFKAIFGSLNSCADLILENCFEVKRLVEHENNNQHEPKIR